MARLFVERNWNSEPLDLERRSDRLYPPAPRLGMVIVTFAALPYIHLQLEARRRFYPRVPALVHDDGSPQRDALARLCAEYGADLECNPTRLTPHLGDLSGFVGGLAWAKDRGLDLLLKVSRRWIFRTDWTKSLTKLAMSSQYATFSNHTTTFDFGFRTECLALSTTVWSSASFLESVALEFRARRSPFVEGYLHEHARRFEQLNCEAAQRWQRKHPKDAARNGYADWKLMGTDRCAPSKTRLWHDANSPRDYYRQAMRWGLDYSEADFADPNGGAGNGTE
jgi:hypothetical protein